ncbi:excalibur calcium-binding domain-containing protein [Pseudanabaena sp. PCC 6802]|uniref:excalibur calcium-binding domain-containing protein n=1 Tax=Pseudanabaena sp. PCC 6802 TaxID=118173 RepID=UPI00037C0101
MKKLIILLVLGFVGWQIYARSKSFLPFTNPIANNKQSVSNTAKPSPSLPKDTSPSSVFKCDGRTYCSQMTSCAEATFFLKNCPNVKMDGNNDGIPCEKQWCR